MKKTNISNSAYKRSPFDLIILKYVDECVYLAHMCIKKSKRIRSMLSTLVLSGEKNFRDL